MTRKLEELFGLEQQVNIDEETGIVEPEELSSELISQDTLNTIEKIEGALPQVRGLEASDAEMDDLSKLAKEAFNNLMDLGMQVDARFSAEIFNSASSMLGHAITAKTAKMTKKLRMIDLQLKKADLDRKIAAAKPNEPTPIGTGKVIDRNELIKMAIAEAAKNKSKDK